MPAAAVAVTDFDGDGRPDLLVGCRKAANAYFHNEGGGRFKNASDQLGFRQRVFNTAALAVADLNRDGAPDLILNNDGQESAILLGALRGSSDDNDGPAVSGTISEDDERPDRFDRATRRQPLALARGAGLHWCDRRRRLRCARRGGGRCRQTGIRLTRSRPDGAARPLDIFCRGRELRRRAGRRSPGFVCREHRRPEFRQASRLSLETLAEPRVRWTKASPYLKLPVVEAPRP